MSFELLLAVYFVLFHSFSFTANTYFADHPIVVFCEMLLVGTDIIEYLFLLGTCLDLAFDLIKFIKNVFDIWRIIENAFFVDLEVHGVEVNEL